MLILPNFIKSRRTSELPLTLEKSERAIEHTPPLPIQFKPTEADVIPSYDVPPSLSHTPKKILRLEWSEGIKQGDQILSWLERKRLLKPHQRYDLSRPLS